MIKKLFSFIFCLAPVGAMASYVYLEPESGETNIALPNTRWSQYDNGLQIKPSETNPTQNTSVVIKQAGTESLTVNATGGIDVAGGLIVGVDAGSETNWLYISDATSAGTSTGFTIKSTGPIKFGNFLQVQSGNYLQIGETGMARVDLTFAPDNTTGIAIDNRGKLYLTNIAALNTSSGTIRNNTNATSLEIDATSITSGAIENMGGTMDIAATGDIDLATNNGTITVFEGAGNTNISGNNLTSGDIQNRDAIMNITLGGDLHVKKLTGITSSTGNLENTSGQYMTIKAADITVDGAMVNTNTFQASNSGTMDITATNLTINGGTGTNASFVNDGNLIINVDGTTTLANGFDVSNMNVNNTFNIKTGGLVSNWTNNNPFLNELNNFVVTLTTDTLNLGAARIVNTNAGGNNDPANMKITAPSIIAGGVENNGQNLNITAVSTTSAVTINGVVTGNSGNTQIIATNTGNAATVTNTVTTGAVTNNAEMLINGATGTTVASITNNAGGNLKVYSGTNSSGTVRVGTVDNADNLTPGETNNYSTLEIRGRQITMGVLNNYAGTTIFQGSDADGDALTTGTINAEGGVINIKSLIGDVTVNGDLSLNKTGGSLNIDGVTKSLTTSGTVAIGGDMTLSDAPTAANGAMNIVGAGVQNFVLTAGQNMTFGGDIVATETGSYRTAKLISKQKDNANNVIPGKITVDGDVTVANAGRLQFGDKTVNGTDNSIQLTIAGELTANNPTTNGDDLNEGKRGVEIYSAANQPVTVGAMSGNGLFVIHGDDITATMGDINITNSIVFNDNTPNNGLAILDTNKFTLTTTKPSASIYAGGINLGAGNTLTMNSAKDITISDTITDNGNLEMTATTIDIKALTNNNQAELNATENITAGAITANTGSTTDITTPLLNAGALTVNNNAVVNIATTSATFAGQITVYNNQNMVQGPAATGVGALNITQSGQITATGLRLNGNFIADGNQTTYTFDTFANITGDMTVNSGMVTMTANAGKISARNITNHDTLILNGTGGIDVSNGTILSDGDLTMNSGTGLISANQTNLINGRTTVTGGGMSISNGYFEQNILRQNYNGILGTGDINVLADNYTIWANGGAQLGGIAQEYGTMTLNTSDLQVTGDIDATDLRVVANPAVNWLTVGVKGDVSGNTKFVGLQRMQIDGNYTYNSNSGLVMPILKPTDAGRDYWADVSLNNDATLGQITNRSPNAEPLISVNGTFITQLENNLNPETGLLNDGTMGVQIFDMIDPGTAIWLLNARLGIVEEGTKIRNVLVQFCNADGTQCFNYLKPTAGINETGENLPAYISVRDTTSDGVADSLYLVFDPRFGGPVEIFKIQPIVGREYNHTNGEYKSAGALDDMIAGRLETFKFYNRTPIEAIPFIFRDTNMAEMANELYDRMEYYEQTHNGAPLARFSRLFQPREMEQLTASIALNEHTSFRDFEDHMLDEFIWNRNRKLRKAWGEFDFGIVNQKQKDDLESDGNRFSFTGGYDWQHTDTLIFGLAGRVSHMSNNSTDKIDLGYKPGQPIAGHAKVDIYDTNIGIGGYLLQNLGTKMRAYGNAFLDMHLLDVSRKQTYMASISGDGTAFSLISEWGLMHDWLNQYIVGNAYARIGYNFGFSITEKAGRGDYMKMKSDGYTIFTPGYSLIAQKRIYPSAWFQVRPYASIGLEYDVLGTPDKAKYKFMSAKSFTKYDIEIDPLWANIGGGVELLSVTGVQVGLDYRYQYNSDIQMHKIKLSGSYRF